jgi:Mg-chelatase subunit ChlD
MRRWWAVWVAIAAMGGLMVPVLALGPVRAAPGDVAPQVVPAAQNESSCTDKKTVNGTAVPLSMRELIPPTIRICETSLVSMTVRADCAEAPLHVMVDIDRSGSMIGQPIQDAKDAAVALVNALDVNNHPNTFVGLVSHGDPPRRDSRLTNNVGTIVGAIRRMGAGGEDNLARSIEMSRAELVQNRGKESPFDVMVVLSDGGQTYPPQDGVKAAAAAKAQGILIASVCLDNGTAGGCEAMRQIASSRRYYFEARDTGSLVRIFTDIANEVRNLSLRSMTIQEILPAGLEYVTDSGAPTPEFDRTGKVMSWTFRFLPKTGETITYQVRPVQLSNFPVAQSTVTFNDSQNKRGSVVVPTAMLSVPVRCDIVVPTFTPTNTPTDTPTATPTNTPVLPSPTPTNTPTNTPTATPTATPKPLPVYLPILNLSRCVDPDRPVDTVLLLDASISMTDATSAGRTKLAAAKDAAKGYVAGMRRIDRTAVIAFNSAVHPAAGLTANQAALNAAIDAIRPAPGTRIDLALDAGAAEITGSGHDPIAKPVIILLTDGRPNGETRDDVLAAGRRAREVAVVFTIGVGDDVDALLLIAVAGDPSRYYPVDDAEALDDIFLQIREKIPCTPGPGEVPGHLPRWLGPVGGQ